MADISQRQSKEEAAKSLLKEVANLDCDSLARTEDLGLMNFEEAVPHFKRLVELGRPLYEADLSIFSISQLNDIIDFASNITGRASRIRKFDPNTQDQASQQRKNMIREIEHAYEDAANNLVPILAFIRSRGPQFEQLKNEIEQARIRIVRMEEEITWILHDVRESVAEIAVSEQAKTFQTASEAHAKLAKGWMVATIVLAIVTLGAAGAFLRYGLDHTPESYTSLTQYVVSKILIMSVLSFATFWCASNYKSQKHNEVLNAHRSNALKVYRSFVDGIKEDQALENTILLHAAQAVFSARPTGYDSPDKNSTSITSVVDLVGRVTQSKGD